MMFTFSLTFIRHGETQYNRDKLLQGGQHLTSGGGLPAGQGVDAVLTEEGVRQAQAAALYLAHVHFSHVLSSDLRRACQTAEVILKGNAHGSDQQILMEPLLRERGFGIAEGRPKEDLKNMAKAAGQSCRDYTPPGGETLEQVKRRFRKFLQLLFQRLVDAHGWSEPGAAVAATTEAGDSDDVGDGLGGVAVHVLAVSHGAYMRVAHRHLLGGAAGRLPPCPNTGLTRFLLTLRRRDDGPALASATCIFANRKEHL